jgi:hypothetical protein
MIGVAIGSYPASTPLFWTAPLTGILNGITNPLSFLTGILNGIMRPDSLEAEAMLVEFVLRVSMSIEAERPDAISPKECMDAAYDLAAARVFAIAL